MFLKIEGVLQIGSYITHLSLLNAYLLPNKIFCAGAQMGGGGWVVGLVENNDSSPFKIRLM